MHPYTVNSRKIIIRYFASTFTVNVSKWVGLNIIASTVWPIRQLTISRSFISLLRGCVSGFLVFNSSRWADTDRGTTWLPWSPLATPSMDEEWLLRLGSSFLNRMMVCRFSIFSQLQKIFSQKSFLISFFSCKETDLPVSLHSVQDVFLIQSSV